jgi:hypothetical protein
MPPTKGPPDAARLDRIVAEARRAREEREKGYREQALRVLPWVCGRCARAFDRANVHLLTVHHKDHDHHHNPADGSNWELLCVYCHEDEHARELNAAGRDPGPPGGDGIEPATHRPFADLAALLRNRK